MKVLKSILLVALVVSTTSVFAQNKKDKKR
jgi:hypothetical protein